MYSALLMFLYVTEIRFNDVAAFSMRVVGGKPCPVNQYPFVVAVRVCNRYAGTKYSHHCGGALLNSNWVLSAAHCYRDEDHKLDDYLVVAGVSKQSDFLSNKAMRSKVNDIAINSFNSAKHDNDIALLKLVTPFKETSTVKYTTLPANSVFPTDISEYFSQCTAMGWGLAIPVDITGEVPDELKISPNQLLCVDLPLIAFKTCRAIFQHLDGEIQITSNQICTLFRRGGKDACSGDSGGPLICGGMQHGITSWGIGCAQPGLPGVFTRVDKYLDWIKSLAGTIKTQEMASVDSLHHKRANSVKVTHGNCSVNKFTWHLTICSFILIYTKLI